MEKESNERSVELVGGPLCGGHIGVSKEALEGYHRNDRLVYVVDVTSSDEEKPAYFYKLEDSNEKAVFVEKVVK